VYNFPMQFLTTMPLSLMRSLSPFMERCVIFVSTDFPLIVAMGTVVFLLFREIPNKDPFSRFENMYRRATDLATGLFGVLGTLVVAVEAKARLMVSRPSVVNPDIHALITETDFSFPSSHAALFAFLAVWIFSIHKKAGIVLVVCAVVIGAARVLAGVHTPLDILCGYLLGIAAGLVVIVVTKHFEARSAREEK
jgi:membrane-associated phospholipid phosphatase